MPAIRPVGDRRKPGRLDEANQVRRDGHAHFVPSAQQLPADGGAGLDIAASPIAASANFIDGSSPSTSPVSAGKRKRGPRVPGSAAGQHNPIPTLST